MGSSYKRDFELQRFMSTGCHVGVIRSHQYATCLFDDPYRRGIWAQGELIPNEADLALEFGCAPNTVNRALRTVADTGLLDRRCKAGTRVAVQPVAKATLIIPDIRSEIEERGQTYGYS